MASIIKEVAANLKTKGWAVIDSTEIVPLIKYRGSSKLERKITTNEEYRKYLGQFIKFENSKGFDSDIEYRYYHKCIKNTLDRDIPEGIVAAEDFEDEDDDIMKWHEDGGYFRAITRLRGTPTEWKDSEDSATIYKLPLYHTLIFTGKERFYDIGIPATPHRMPFSRNPRKLVVSTCSW